MNLHLEAIDPIEAPQLSVPEIVVICVTIAVLAEVSAGLIILT